MGLVFGLAKGFTLDLSGYYKDVKNLIQRVVYIDTNDNLYETTGNRDYADVRGFSLRLNKKARVPVGFRTLSLLRRHGQKLLADGAQPDY